VAATLAYGALWVALPLSDTVMRIGFET
jgi:hypothetical protein